MSPSARYTVFDGNASDSRLSHTHERLEAPLLQRGRDGGSRSAHSHGCWAERMGVDGRSISLRPFWGELLHPASRTSPWTVCLVSDTDRFLRRARPTHR